MTVAEFVDIMKGMSVKIAQPVVCWPGNNYHMVQVGKINTKLNAEQRGLGTCVERAPRLGKVTVVTAADLGEAATRCASIYSIYDTAYNLRAQGYDAPQGYFYCSTNL